jgi:hypothetical protein
MFRSDPSSHPLERTFWQVVAVAFLTCLAAFGFCATAKASDLATIAPNRPADYTVSSGFVDPNVWELGVDCSDNANTYPLTVRAATSDVVSIVYRLKLEYVYAGSCFIGSSAPCSGANVHVNSWNAYWLGHNPNAIGGMSWAQAPVPFATFPFNGPTAGGAMFTFVGIQAGTQLPGGVVATGTTTFESPVITFSEEVSGPGTYTFQSNDVESWKTVNGTRNGRDFHRLWFTPASDPSYYVTWLNGASGNYSHAFSYDGGVRVRVRMEVWEIR